MNIIERGKAFVESLRAVAVRTVWDWKRCPRGGSTLTIKNDSYMRRLWFFSGHQPVRVQRHLGHDCHRILRSSRRCWCVAVGMRVRCGGAPWITGCMGAYRCAARRSFCVRSWGGRSAGGCGGPWIRRPRVNRVGWRPVRCIAGWIGLGWWRKRRNRCGSKCAPNW